MPWYVLLLRTYFAALPGELIDAARIDGASEWRIFFRNYVPLSRSALATVALFCALVFLMTHRILFPLRVEAREAQQLLLRTDVPPSFSPLETDLDVSP